MSGPRIHRIRVQYQFDSLDCGPCCLAMISSYYGRFFRREYLRQLCEQDRQGASLGKLAQAAEEIGFRALTVRVRLHELPRVKPPCIAFLTERHYVVIHRVSRRRVFLCDPAVGFIDYTHEEFARLWCATGVTEVPGVLLLLEPTPDLRPSDSRHPVGFAIILRPLRSALQANVLPFLIGALILLSAQVALPFLSAALVDAGIGGADVGLLYAVLIGQLVLIATRTGVELLQGWILAYLGQQAHTTLVGQFLRKISRLPFSFFRNKRVGDTMQRVEDHQTIQALLTESAGQILLAVTSLAIFGVVLAIFSPLLLLIYGLGSAAYLLYSARFLRTLRGLTYKTFSLMAERQSSLLQFLLGIEEIKLNNASDFFRGQWERAQNSVARVQVRFQLLCLVQHAGGTLLNEIKNAVLVVVAANEVVRGEMTLGMMIAVQYVIGQLNWPLTQAIGLMARANNAYTSFERAREVHLLTDEDAHLSRHVAADGDGSIRLSHVNFRYCGTGSQHEVLKNVSFTIQEGKTTAIVGRSGSGKTTLLKLLLKMHAIDGGSMMVGARSLETLPARLWRDQCGVVMQDGFVFSDTILNNLTVGMPADIDRVRVACRIALADEFIESLPLGYATRIGSDGCGLSRGQLQRVLIARALYKNPKYIFLDEATSALDAETEARIAAALQQALEGRTALVIAHRLSTVRRAHKIVVLDQGRIVEEGDHETLLAARGQYYQLIRHQLAGGAQDHSVAISS